MPAELKEYARKNVGIDPDEVVQTPSLRPVTAEVGGSLKGEIRKKFLLYCALSAAAGVVVGVVVKTAIGSCKPPAGGLKL